jgi:hypothetical protein
VRGPELFVFGMFDVLPDELTERMDLENRPSRVVQRECSERLPKVRPSSASSTSACAKAIRPFRRR